MELPVVTTPYWNRLPKTSRNMISMALTSLFLPLLAKQVLLNNFLSDIPAMGIAADHVDPDWERRPHHWDTGMIRTGIALSRRWCHV